MMGVSGVVMMGGISAESSEPRLQFPVSWAWAGEQGCIGVGRIVNGSNTTLKDLMKKGI